MFYCVDVFPSLYIAIEMGVWILFVYMHRILPVHLIWLLFIVLFICTHVLWKLQFLIPRKSYITSKWFTTQYSHHIQNCFFMLLMMAVNNKNRILCLGLLSLPFLVVRPKAFYTKYRLSNIQMSYRKHNPKTDTQIPIDWDIAFFSTIDWIH